MDIKQLEAFVFVAKLGSFSKAGERLFLTQPTVSAHISRLEKELGVNLIVRTTKSVYPSEEGKRLLNYATEILRLHDEALEQFTKSGRKTPSLCELFRINMNKKSVISLVGAGGKTTFLFSLAHELASQKKRVAVTTTTRIFRPDSQQCADVVTDGDLQKIEIALSELKPVTVGIPMKDNKLSKPSAEVLNYLNNNADFLLIEADGAHFMPIKVPNDREPAIYSGTDRIIAVGGMSCIGKPLGQVCHRAQLAEQMLNVNENYHINASDMAKLLLKSYGKYGSKVIYALNQADNEFYREQAKQVVEILMQNGVENVVVTSFLSKQFEYYRNRRK